MHTEDLLMRINSRFILAFTGYLHKEEWDFPAHVQSEQKTAFF